MDNILIKKKEYTPVKELGENTLLVKKDDVLYVVKWLGVKTRAFSDFKYSTKRMTTCNVRTPKVLILDKKTGYALLEYVDGKTAYEELIEHDFEEDIYSQLFNMNWLARRNMMQLDFNPQNFRIANGKLYYMPFTFGLYDRKKDFTENDLRLWFYTKEFRELIAKDGLLFDKSRMLPDYEINKKLVLTVVKFYR